MCSFSDTYTGYFWTKLDNDVMGSWTGNTGKVNSKGLMRNETTEKDYCVNKLPLIKNNEGKLINEGKLFVWKGSRGDDQEFPGCDSWCCQKKASMLYFQISYLLTHLTGYLLTNQVLKNRL